MKGYVIVNNRHQPAELLKRLDWSVIRGQETSDQEKALLINRENQQKPLVVQWGASIQNESDCHVLNPKIAQDRANDVNRCERFFQLYGVVHDLKTKSMSSGFERTFAAAVFGHQVLRIFTITRVNGTIFYDGLRESEENIKYRRMSRMAIRACAALDLDFALVEMTLNASGQPVVRNIDSSPDVSGEAAEQFAEAMLQYAAKYFTQSYHITKPLIGMDPEFVLVDETGEVVPASRFVRKQGRVGCDAVIVDGKLERRLAELRPLPAEEPKQVIIQLMKTMHQAARLFEPNLRWLAGGMPKKGYTLGGHIHLSEIWFHGQLVRVMNRYLALPLALIYSELVTGRLPRFGWLSDVREKPHGGFEYRTLPSFLTSPVATKGIIALTRLIADHYDKLDQTPLTDDTVIAYMNGDKRLLLAEVIKAWKHIERLPDAAKYKSYLLPFKRKCLFMESWDELSDFRLKWRIPLSIQGSKLPYS